jgi:hypothetical protein
MCITFKYLVANQLDQNNQVIMKDDAEQLEHSDRMHDLGEREYCDTIILFIFSPALTLKVTRTAL